MAKNVLGNPLVSCSQNPKTGFFRNGICDTCKDDYGMHTICCLMTEEFLIFSKEHGNDLSTPIPEFNFPGLKPGNYWCVCLSRWIQAYNANCAPNIKLSSTHASVLEFVELDILEKFDIDNVN